MRERKYVKLRVDMFEDTKFKIIDTKPERDLIHYIWTRLVTLAGKVDLEGNLYMSKNIPYTIETLAIEFNRGSDQIKLALDVLMELEMIEFTEDYIYTVKNFMKHQNIKVKEKVQSKDKDEDINNKAVKVNEDSKNEVYDNEHKELENKTIKTEVESVENYNKGNLESITNNVNKIKNNISNEKVDNNPQDKIPIILEVKKNKRARKKKKDMPNKISLNSDDEEIEEFCFYDNKERSLGKGESVVSAWAF